MAILMFPLRANAGYRMLILKLVKEMPGLDGWSGLRRSPRLSYGQ